MRLTDPTDNVKSTSEVEVEVEDERLSIACLEAAIAH